MTRLTKIALVLAMPASFAGCADDTDNETNATSPATTGETDPSASMSDPSMSDPSASMTDPTDTDSADTTDTAPVGCVDGDDPGAPRMEVGALIEADTTLTCDTVWVLTQATFVRNAVLTVEPGTTVVGANGSVLAIEATSRLEAAGTPGGPIVFTSAQPKGERQRADWGGVVLIGNGLVNTRNGTGVVEGFADPPSYGGNDPAHNCGTLQYVRVEFAGFQVVDGNELNGIGWFGCGTDSVADHVQSHMGSDDAFEWFGGGFDAKYLIATGMQDDAVDTDYGFAGAIQYVFVHQDPLDESGNHALEWANNPDDFSATPIASPAVSNLTFVGQGPDGNAGKSIGFVLKEGTEASIYNSYFTNVTGFGASLQDQETIDIAADGVGIVVEGTFWGTTGGFGFQGDGPYSWTEIELESFLLDQPGNMDGVDLGLDATWAAPNIKPAADSAAVGAGVAAGVPGIEDTTYVGAVDPEATDDWTQASWVNYELN